MGAVPVFVLLSLPALIGIIFTYLGALTTYFFVPQYGFYSSLLSMIVFIVVSFFLVVYGANGIALANFVSSLVGTAFTIIAVNRILRGLKINFKLKAD